MILEGLQMLSGCYDATLVEAPLPPSRIWYKLWDPEITTGSQSINVTTLEESELFHIWICRKTGNYSKLNSN